MLQLKTPPRNSPFSFAVDQMTTLAYIHEMPTMLDFECYSDSHLDTILRINDYRRQVACISTR
jgi:hypothetical protein